MPTETVETTQGLSLWHHWRSIVTIPKFSEITDDYLPISNKFELKKHIREGNGHEKLQNIPKFLFLGKEFKLYLKEISIFQFISYLYKSAFLRSISLMRALRPLFFFRFFLGSVKAGPLSRGSRGSRGLRRSRWSRGSRRSRESRGFRDEDLSGDGGRLFFLEAVNL